MPYKQPPKHTQFKPGHSGNPKGRTPGLSITAMIREELEKTPKGQEVSNKQLLIDKIIDKAINHGDKDMIRLCWDHLDGKAVQKNKHSGENEEPVSIRVVFADGSPIS